ncbi:MAG TPA: cysteine desulfurase [Gammaproteobacteria bacterium]|nr:cysteine desulfurase [Gammaproteobacteria bacterium]
MVEHWMDWASLLLRWLHVITGIAWIGSSFYFIWLDLSLRKPTRLPNGVHGESWSVHGGGFYHAQKYMVAPDSMPKELHWFKYESYFTWISGFALLAVTYYWSAEAFLIDSSVRDLSVSQAIGISIGSLVAGWIVYDVVCKTPIGRNLLLLGAAVYMIIILAALAYGEIFGSRAALLHVGAVVATWMTGNVFFIIIPNQKKVVASLQRGEAPDPALGQQAKQRSTHNNYLTLPVLFMMLSNHYPMTFVGEDLWILVGLVVLIGAIIRDYFNTSHSGVAGVRVRWQWPTASALIIILALWTRPETLALDAQQVITDQQVHSIVMTHCAGCHAARPMAAGYTAPPKGVVLETLSDVQRYKAQVYAQSVSSQAMPVGNLTEMTLEERAILGHWLEKH